MLANCDSRQQKPFCFRRRGANHVVITADAKEKKENQNGTQDLRACWQLTATCARPSDARIATAASLYIGALLLRSTSSNLAHTSGSPLDP